MTYSKRIKRTVNWSMSKHIAFQILRQHNIQDFPIDMLDLMKQYPNLKVITYSKMAENQGVSIHDVITVNSSEDGCIHYDAKKDRYIIAYNDLIESDKRIYWTLAHEFGHYSLGHLKETKRSSLSRLSLNDSEYDIFEKEAHYFARFLINPPPLIKEWQLVTKKRIQDFFAVSHSVASHTMNYLNKISNKGISSPLPIFLQDQLSGFLQKVNSGKTCKRCDCFFVIKYADYCPFCGHDEQHIFFKGEEIELKYPGINHTNGKMDVCPRCSNEEILDGAKNCNQCGIYLLNHCTNSYKDSDKEMIFECLDSLPFNSRYCHACGNKSTYLDNGLLNDWEQTMEDQFQQENIHSQLNTYGPNGSPF